MPSACDFFHQAQHAYASHDLRVALFIFEKGGRSDLTVIIPPDVGDWLHYAENY